MNTTEKLSTLFQIYNRYKMIGLITYIYRYILSKGRSRSIRRIFLFILENPENNSKMILSAKDHTFKFADENDLRRIHSDPDLHVSAKWNNLENDLSALKKGDRCLIQMNGNEIVGYAWIAGSPLVEIMWGFHFNMPDDTVYNYKSFTSNKYRGYGFQALRHLKLLEHVKETGQCKLFGYVDHMNFKSLHGVRKSGYRKIGVLKCNKRESNIEFRINVSMSNWSMEKR